MEETKTIFYCEQYFNIEVGLKFENRRFFFSDKLLDPKNNMFLYLLEIHNFNISIQFLSLRPYTPLRRISK